MSRDHAPCSVIVVDNYDSFTFNLVHALELFGARCRVVKNDQHSASDLISACADGMVISAGPCTPTEAGVSLELARRMSSMDGAPPLLGICLGHQAIAQALGARLAPSRKPRHGMVARLTHDGRRSLADLPSPVEVALYNSLVVDGNSLPEELEGAGVDELGELQALRHKTAPIEGFQFHPESHLTPACRVLFARWLERCRQSRLARERALMQAVAP